MKKAITFLTLIFCIQFLTAQTYYVDSGTRLNMREMPGKGHKVVMTIPGNSEVKLIEKKGEWWKVDYNGTQGYVHADYLSESKPAGSNNNTAQNSRPKRAKKQSAAGNSPNYQWGVGLRFGDPSGITVKKYMSDNRSLEGNIGRTRFFTGDGYYDRRFERVFDDKKYKDFQYLGYSGTTPIGIQAHYLFHKSFNVDELSNLQWYYGAGVQLRFHSFIYEYRYKLEGSPVWYYDSDKMTDIDLGADGIIGLEYLIPDVPVALFLDMVLFVELVDRPFLFWGQGGFGARYNF